MPSVLEKLFGLRSGEIRRLVAVNLALDPETQRMLEAAKSLIESAPPSSVAAEAEIIGEFRPPINWARTVVRRAVTADPSRFVCRPIEKRYDTPLTRLIVLALRKCSELTAIARFQESGPVEARVKQVGDEARALRASAKLSGVAEVEWIPEPVIRGLHRYRGVDRVARFVRRFREAVDDLTPEDVRQTIEPRILGPSADARLFELLVGFRMIDALTSFGYEPTQLRLIGHKVPLAALIRAGSRLELWWQRSIWSLPAAAGVPSRYRLITDAAQMAPAPLLPDFLLLGAKPAQLVIVEVKLTEDDEMTADRRGIAEAMAYLYDAANYAEAVESLRALVVAWNSKATPSPGSLVVVTGAPGIRDGLAAVLAPEVGEKGGPIS